MSSQITLTNQISELARASEWLSEWLTACALPGEMLYFMRLCLEEVLTNIITHGYDGGPHEISVIAVHDENEACLTVVDSAKAFDPLAATIAPLADRLEDAHVGGNGLILIRSFAGRLAYRRDNEFNRLELFFTRPDGTPPPNT